VFIEVVAYARSMTFARLPSLLTEKLRKIITRDTIIAVHIAFIIYGILDSIVVPEGTVLDKILITGSLFVFLIIGLVRLKIFSTHQERRPIIAIIIYQLLGLFAVSYLVDIRSFWAFFWLIPIFLANFYYGKKGAYLSLGVLALALGLQLALNQAYITSYEDYLYVISEFIVICAFSLLFRDLLEITEEDRDLLVTSLEKAEVSEERLDAMINSITDGVITVDQSGIISLYNPAALNLTDTHTDLRGRNFLESILLTDLSGKRLTSEKLFLEGASNLETKLQYTNGEIATINLSAMPIRANYQQVSRGHVLLMRDITKKKSLEDERNAFISLMSHELRTPLAVAEGVASNAEIMLKNNSDPNAASLALEQIHKQIQSLISLTNEFALLMETNPDKQLIIKAPVPLPSLYDSLRSSFTSRMAEKKLSFRIEPSNNTPTVIETSPQYLERVLSSLIENALKFTEVGSIRLVVEEKNNSMVFSVIDTGIGIAKSDQQKIFQPFFQGSEFETRTEGGLGVGLNLARKLTETLGGELSFESEVGHGSTFRLSLPLEEKESAKS
jgi:PAS domain S-box-containing protein